MPLATRFLELLPFIVLGAGVLFALLAVVLTRRVAARTVWAAWLLGPVALTVALGALLAFEFTPGIISFRRWLLSFALTLAMPTAVAALAATRLATRKRVLHALATLVVFAIAYPLGGIAAGHVVELIETVQ
jgi:hypothetical protein